MFRNKRHIRARNNEWIHVHRDRGNNNKSSTGQIIYTVLGWLIVGAVAFEILKAVLPYLLVIVMIGGVGFAFLNSRR